MTITLKNKTPLTVPDRIRQEAGLKSGDQVEFRVSGRVIRIVPKPPSADENTAAERRAIDRGIAQSRKEYQQGKNADPFDTADAFLADLHQENAKLDARKRKHAGK